ncbi:MAG: SUMF1/EgtB/PvdO family nonheme iron enzyme [Anaerolineales bacterium]|nr:SUMF1/EgtB/PvdO family nonheme iron enzyme [Anaerolineales bacterium]
MEGGGGSEPPDQDAQNGGQGDEKAEEAEDVSVDYCDLPGGTRVTWFDLSTFIFIPQSSYQMGFDLLAGEFDFEPSHPISLGAFWMHETEVTNRQYSNCVAAGICDPPQQYPDVPYWFALADRLDNPVVGVTWEQADAYCEWIGTRLPTEAEWELAARGVDSDPFPWGIDEPDCEYANYLGCLDPEDPQPVIAGYLTKGISRFEMLDMAGNVNEWVHDWYGADYYQNSPSANPPGPDTGELRVWRGGGYNSSNEGVFSYLRDSFRPDEAQPDLGFRCAWSCGEDVPPNLCQLPPSVSELPPAERDPGQPVITGEGYCEWRRGTKSAGVVLSSPSGTDLSQFEFSSPDGPVTCNPVGDMIVCYGPPIQPDTNVTITICPDCPPGTYYDAGDGTCMPLVGGEGDMEPIPIAGLCDPGYYHTDGCGCILEGIRCLVPVPQLTPINPEDLPPGVQSLIGTLQATMGDGEEPEPFQINPALLVPLESWPGNPYPPLEFDPNWDPTPDDCQQGDLIFRCAPGTFPMTDFDGCRVCMPLRRLSDCPEGYMYDNELDCCVPEKTNITCPRLTYYDPITNSCIPIQIGNTCFDLTVYVPECPPQPTQERPTPIPTCENPRSYTTQQSCEAAYCLWYQPLTGGPAYCTYP